MNGEELMVHGRHWGLQRGPNKEKPGNKQGRLPDGILMFGLRMQLEPAPCIENRRGHHD